MNSIYTAIKFATLSILLTVALVCVFSEPADSENWYLVFFASKVIGLTAAYIFYRLVNRWNKSTMKKIARYCNEEDL